MGKTQEGVGSTTAATRVALQLGVEAEVAWWDAFYDGEDPEGPEGDASDEPDAPRTSPREDTRGSRLRVWPKLLSITTQLWKEIVRAVHTSVDPSGTIRRGTRAKTAARKAAKGVVGSVRESKGRRGTRGTGDGATPGRSVAVGRSRPPGPRQVDPTRDLGRQRPPKPAGASAPPPVAPQAEPPLRRVGTGPVTRSQLRQQQPRAANGGT